MRSSLSVEDFRGRLTELTNIGEPIINGTPFAIMTVFDSPKSLFYGQFDKESFRLTSNGLTHITPYIIDGTFTQTDNGTEVNYKIRKIWFGYLWIRLLPIIAILSFNLVFVKEMGRFGLVVFIPINLFLLLLFIPIILTNVKKKRLEELFIKHFEIN
ncbi:MAG: hypothetical protein KF845_13135 [Cyclobacteriaceae bacterium]|nr:hypothetical protein [Cyclobacteriaceae bacterium]